MREFEFRVWEDYGYGQFIYIKNRSDLNYYAHNGCDGPDEKLSSLNTEQYTGLKDKNGKKIFEGDVIKIDDIEGIVIFKNGSVRLDIDNDVYSHSILNQERTIRFEIIGNIHEGNKCPQ